MKIDLRVLLCNVCGLSFTETVDAPSDQAERAQRHGTCPRCHENDYTLASKLNTFTS